MTRWSFSKREWAPIFRSGGLAVADRQRGGVAPTFLHAYPSAARITAEPLDGDTVALVVWFRGESQIQVSEVIPAGSHAAVVRHIGQAGHLHICCARHCPQARAWLAEFAPSRAYASQSA